MARTKQTARKWTGGQPPRKQLPTMATKLKTKQKTKQTKKGRNHKIKIKPQNLPTPYKQRCIDLCKRHCPAMNNDDHARFAKEIGMFLSLHSSSSIHEVMLTRLARIMEQGSRAGVLRHSTDPRRPIGTDLYGHEAYLTWAKTWTKKASA